MRLRHGFTIVELLVVIAIIAILIALLLPVLGPIGVCWVFAGLMLLGTLTTFFIHPPQPGITTEDELPGCVAQALAIQPVPLPLVPGVPKSKYCCASK